MSTGAAVPVHLDMLLRRVICQETGPHARHVSPTSARRSARAAGWGARACRKELADRDLFHTVVMLRNRLRTLEQQLNAAELPKDVKVKLQGTSGVLRRSLTSFNVLFAEGR